MQYAIIGYIFGRPKQDTLNFRRPCQRYKGQGSIHVGYAIGILKTCESVILPVLCKPCLTLSATNIAKTQGKEIELPCIKRVLKQTPGWLI